MAVELAEKVTSEVEERVAALDSEVIERQKTFEDEIAPKVAERDELKELLTRMRGEAAQAQSNPVKPRRGGRRRKGGTRAEQFVEIVSENPGIKTSEVAKKIGMGANYLYRIKADAEKEGLIRVEGRKLFPITK